MKTQQAYEADIYGSKSYFSHDYAGLLAVKRIAEILRVHIEVKTVRIGCSKVTIS